MVQLGMLQHLLFQMYAWILFLDDIRVKQPILDQFEEQSQPLYASARLWDDGIIDPRKTRDVIALSLKAALNAPISETRFSVFRM